MDLTCNSHNIFLCESQMTSTYIFFNSSAKRYANATRNENQINTATSAKPRAVDGGVRKRRPHPTPPSMVGHMHGDLLMRARVETKPRRRKRQTIGDRMCQLDRGVASHE